MQQEIIDLLAKLSHIPAPSNHEERRALFIHDWLADNGIPSVIDEVQNVVVSYGEGPSFDVIAAHTDVVFPDENELVQKWENGRLYCPGSGDDTANVVLMLLCLKSMKENHIQPKRPLLFVANSGEEGLGNLKGIRNICKNYEGRIHSFTSFDGCVGHVVVRAVGSKRYRLSVRTKGGHSYADFGEPNAIAEAAGIITALYHIGIVPKGSATYNVGTIMGGTSINSIAQDCEFTFEFRSVSEGQLAKLEQLFKDTIQKLKHPNAVVSVEEIGNRPCGKEDIPGKDAMVAFAKKCILQNSGIIAGNASSSTDCNIPLSLGIPSVCFGLVKGAGAHTRQEYVELDSLESGFRLGYAYLTGMATGSA